MDLIHLHKSPILRNLKGKGTEQGFAEHRAAMTKEQRSEINRKRREAYHKKKANSKNDKLSIGDILSFIMWHYL